MGEAKRRCKNREERVRLAIKEQETQEQSRTEAEIQRLLSMTPEEKEAEELRKKKAKRVNLLLATALTIGHH